MITYKYGIKLSRQKGTVMFSCHYHPQRERVFEVKMLNGFSHFICQRCCVEDSALEAEVREARGECQECGCETDDFTENCDHCDTYHKYMRVSHQCDYETRYERQQLAGNK